MLDPVEIAKWEQNVAEITETYPPMLWGFYAGLKSKGFSEQAALFLTNTFLQSIVLKPAPPAGEG